MWFSHRHLLGIADLSRSDVSHLLDAAEALVGAPDNARLAGRVQVNAFFENSTRTSLSFELAGRRSGAHVLTMAVAQSSIAKGESLADTARTLAAIGADVLVVRHGDDGALAVVAEAASCALVNAGDGANEHPTQALIDALTLRRRFGRLNGLTVAICGDIAHSRVARSNMLLLTRMGATVRVTGPAALVPTDLPPGVMAIDTLDQAIAGADAIMMLRVQHERIAGAIDLTAADYHARYGLTPARLARAPAHAVVMHPGPINRGVEIADEVADDPERSTILEQAALGVPVRRACLEALLL